MADHTIVAGDKGAAPPGHQHPHHHHPMQQHHFDTMEQQYDSSSFGMWVFLVQEVMFFGGLFVAYLVYRHAFYTGFGEASSSLDLRLGTINTAVLIMSSLTMALAVNSAQLGKRKLLMLFLSATMVLGAIFLGVKVVEYHSKYEEAHIPGSGADLGIIQIKPFCFHAINGSPCPAEAEEKETGHPENHDTSTPKLSSPGGATPNAEPGVTVTQPAGHEPGGETGPVTPGPGTPRERSLPGSEIYFSLYFAMTGMHALHMIIGMGLLVWLLWNAYKGLYTAEYFTPVENFGLYWHFVDIIWIFLFPLLYLINRHNP